jgi:threonine aldolase
MIEAEPEPRPVDLRSDTVTRPTDGMRRAMATAGVGDDVLDGDPTVGRLEREVADLLGKEAALFFPSGCQANQTALALHAEPGTEVICDAEAHVLHYELGAPSVVASAQLRPVPSEGGVLSGEACEEAIRPGDRYHPDTSLLWTENTHNLQGGVAVPVEALREVQEVAGRHGLPVHLDGARLWNASVASGTPLREFAACADTVMVTLSKGLGCPVGSMLAGSRPRMETAWKIRKRLGGGMRQAGILAAAGIYALKFHLEALEEDHRRAGALADGCAEIPGVAADPPDTNIVMIRVEREDLDAAEVSRRLDELDVRILPSGKRRLRAVTHRNVDDDDVDRALRALQAAMAG